MTLADEFRSQGNKSFKNGNIDQAIKHYFDAIKYYPLNHPDLALAYANRAACYLKLVRIDIKTSFNINFIRVVLMLLLMIAAKV